MTDIPVLYEDQHMLVVNKPAGIPVHAGPKGGENVETLIQSRFDPRRRQPSLAHRLDRDTSGCLVFGKTQPALRRLNYLFANRQMEKIYWAITDGVPPEAEGLIDAPLAKRSDDPRSWWMEVNAKAGQAAQTVYKVMAKTEIHALIACYPKTGRTHQIRVHLKHIGCPIVGDAIYGKAGEWPLLLHARSLTFPFENNTPVTFTADAPASFQDALKAFKLEP